MTSDDLTQIESSLGIQLPVEYREVMSRRGAELASKVIPGAGDDESTLFFQDRLYLTPRQLIFINREQRESGTADAFPDWHKTFVLVGDDGGGNYSSIRVDGQPGVFQIGTDCGKKPKKLNVSLDEYIDEHLKRYEDALEENVFRLRQSPSAGVSSFSPTCPAAERVALYLRAGIMSGNARVVYQGDDKGVSTDMLMERGVKIPDLLTGACHLATVLLRAPAGKIEATAEYDEEDPQLWLRFSNVPDNDCGRGYGYIALQVAGKAAQIDFFGLGKPKPRKFPWTGRP
jgi:hypothetical protein